MTWKQAVYRKTTRWQENANRCRPAFVVNLCVLPVCKKEMEDAS